MTASGPRRRALAWLTFAALGLGAVAPAQPASASPRPARVAPPGVLATTDSGINPYHDVFRDDSPLARKHPSTYLPGFPKRAEALHLTLDAPNYWTAVRKDCAVWSSVVRNRLYWIPGTKIVGAIRLSNPDAIDCSDPNPQGLPILDYDFHGTMVASRAVGNGYGACPECRLVFIQGALESQDWVADNASWIDAQSNSWGYMPYWDPASTGFFNSPEFIRDIERAAQKVLSFWATGNGAVTHVSAPVGHPSLLDPRMTPSIVMVGAHDSGQMATWHGFSPHVVADGCAAPAAHHESLHDSSDDLSGGTSGATPYAAGVAMRELIEARRILSDGSTGGRGGVVAAGGNPSIGTGPLEDGRLELEEWKELVLKTATPRPKADRNDGPQCPVTHTYPTLPASWEQMPDGFPEFVTIGYGAADGAAAKRAADVLWGREPMPDRAATDAYFETQGSARSASHTVYTAP